MTNNMPKNTKHLSAIGLWKTVVAKPGAERAQRIRNPPNSPTRVDPNLGLHITPKFELFLFLGLGPKSRTSNRPCRPPAPSARAVRARRVTREETIPNHIAHWNTIMPWHANILNGNVDFPSAKTYTKDRTIKTTNAQAPNMYSPEHRIQRTNSWATCQAPIALPLSQDDQQGFCAWHPIDACWFRLK